jgi:hypothetical protein
MSGCKKQHNERQPCTFHIFNALRRVRALCFDLGHHAERNLHEGVATPAAHERAWLRFKQF